MHSPQQEAGVNIFHYTRCVVLVKLSKSVCSRIAPKNSTCEGRRCRLAKRKAILGISLVLSLIASPERVEVVRCGGGECYSELLSSELAKVGFLRNNSVEKFAVLGQDRSRGLGDASPQLRVSPSGDRTHRS